MTMLGMLYKKLRRKVRGYSSEEFIQDLKRGGCTVGEGTFFFNPRETFIDNVKPWLISIGSYCKITARVTILAHDYSRSVVRYSLHENIAGSLPVYIGNNVFIGMGATILMGADIGDNCIIGAGSVVKGTIPPNSVVAGNPARVICNLDEYARKRRSRCVEEAVKCVKHSLETRNRVPTIKEMGDGFAWLYLPRSEETLKAYPEFFNLSGDDKYMIEKDFMESHGKWKNYEDFVEYVENLGLK